MSTQSERVIILRYSGEISTKSNQTRQRFTQRLRRNLKAALNSLYTAEELDQKPFTLNLGRDRGLVHCTHPDAIATLRRVAGVQAIGSAKRFAYESKEDLLAIGAELYGEAVTNKTFMVRVRRVGQRHLFSVQGGDLERELGSRLFAASAGVDLTQPELKIAIELHPDFAYFYEANEQRGYGGLPIGTEGRALTLISGGFDSAVAAWRMMNRGVELDFLFFNLAGSAQVQGVRKVLSVLAERWCYGARSRVFIVDLRPAIMDMKLSVQGRYWQVLLKRLMFRAAEMIAQKHKHDAIITGESLGQVSSQAMGTLAHLATIDTEVFRPLVGLHKEEILESARLIGTFEPSSKNPEFCALEGGRPVTKIKRKTLDELEECLNSNLLKVLVRDLRETKLYTFVNEDPEFDLASTSPKEEATVVDLRTPEAFSQWHYPGAILLSFGEAFATLKDQTGPFYLYCARGLKSAFVAEQLYHLGLEAAFHPEGAKKLKAQTQNE